MATRIVDAILGLLFTLLAIGGVWLFAAGVYAKSTDLFLLAFCISLLLRIRKLERR